MRRWLLRISIGVAILFVLAIATVQAVLWSPLPKRIVMQQIQAVLGLRISAESLSSGWLGKTRLTNVSLGLPLSKGDFLKVKRLSLKHNSLFGLVVGHSFTIDSIEIDDPVVEVMQDQQGQWNLQQVAELLANAGGANSAQQTAASTGVPRLPKIILTDGRVQISDNQKHTLTLSPLNVTGKPDGALVWIYDLTVADSIKLHGELAPGGNWQHRVTLTAANLDPLLSGWGIPTYSAVVKANWAGQLTDGKVTGALSLEQATARAVPALGDVKLAGSIDVQSANGVVTINPHLVNLTTTDVMLPNIGIRSGSIVSNPSGFHATSVKVSALGGVADLDADFDPASQAADLKATWSGISLTKETSQSGTLKASLRQPFAGQPVIKAELEDTGSVGEKTATSSPGQWDARVNLTGIGSSWSKIDWVLTAPRLAYTTGGEGIDLSQTSAHVRQMLPIIELTDLSLPASVTSTNNTVTFACSGGVDLAKKIWNFDAAGAFTTSYQHNPVPINIGLHVSGDHEFSRAKLTSLTIGLADITVVVDGSYDSLNSKRVNPVDLHVKLTQQSHIAPDALIQGEVSGDFSIVGVLFTDDGHFRPYLTTTGDLRSSDLVLLDRSIGDVDIKLTGITAAPKISAKQFGPIVTELHTTDCFLFNAPWGFSADYPDPDSRLNISLHTHKLPLDELAKFAKIQGVTGQLADASWTAKISSPTLSGIDLQSEYHLLKPSGVGVTADTVDATVTLHDGVIALNPLLARSGSGTVTTTASVDLKSPRAKLLTETNADHWPYPISTGVVAQVSAHNSMNVDLQPRLAASGTLSGSADVLVGRAVLATAKLSASISRRTINLEDLSGNILNGTWKGSAAIDLEKPLEATGRITCRNIDGATLSTIFPTLQGSGGAFSAALTLAPARDPRPLGPVRIDFNLAAENGHFRSLRVGGKGLLAMHLVCYADTDRAVLDPNYSVLYLGGGVVHLWGRVDDRGGRGISTLANIGIENVQLDQIAHIDTKLTQSVPGVLNGQIGIVRSGPSASQVVATAHLDLTQSDLVNFGPLNALYDLMHAAGGLSKHPDGTGSVDIAFEQNVIRVNRFEFFHRGVDAWGLFKVGPLNYQNFGATFVSGQVVGTPRALKGTRVQLLGDFDTIFSALAGQLSSVNVTGTIDTLKYAQATLSDIGTAMRQLLVGDAGANPQ